MGLRQKALLREIGIAMEQNTPASDYLAPNISELALNRVKTVIDPFGNSKRPQNEMTRRWPDGCFPLAWSRQP